MADWNGGPLHAASDGHVCWRWATRRGWRTWSRRWPAGIDRCAPSGTGCALSGEIWGRAGDNSTRRLIFSALSSSILLLASSARVMGWGAMCGLWAMRTRGGWPTGGFGVCCQRGRARRRRGRGPCCAMAQGGSCCCGWSGARCRPAARPARGRRLRELTR